MTLNEKASEKWENKSKKDLSNAKDTNFIATNINREYKNVVDDQNSVIVKKEVDNGDLI